MNFSKRFTIVLAAMTAVLAFGDDAAPVAAEAAVEAVKEEAPAVAEAAVEAVAEAVKEEVPAAVEAEAEAAGEEAPAAEAAPVEVEPAAEPAVVEVKAEEEKTGEDVPTEEDVIEGAEVSESSDPSKISLSLDAVELPDVVRLFTRLSGANIICNTTNLSGTVTANLNDVDWQAALKHILDLQGLELSEKPAGSGIFVISSVAPDAPPKTFTRTYKLDYIKANEAKTVIEGILGLDKAVSAARKATPKTLSKKGGDEKEVADVAVMENGRVVSYPAANKLVVTATEDKLLEVEEVLKEIDVMRQQVYIEAKIVQVSGEDSKKTGIDWSFLDGYTIGLKDPTYQTAFTWSRTDEKAFVNSTIDKGSATTDFGGVMKNNGLYSSLYRIDNAHTRPDGAWTAGHTRDITDSSEHTIQEGKYSVFNADALNLVISALQTADSYAQISNPKMIVANEEHAVIDVTTKIPYVEVDHTFDAESQKETWATKMATIPLPSDPREISYIEGAFFSYGLKVNVTPRINNPSNITVVIEPSLSSLDTTQIDPDPKVPAGYYAPAGSDGTRFPLISTKSVRTTFSLGNGQTAVIGGLTETVDREREKKIPVLGSIPVIGKYLFSHTEKYKQQLETIIFVTVGIVDPESNEARMGLPDGARLTQKRISADGKIIDKKFKEFEKDDEKDDEMKAFIEKAKADGALVPEPVEE